MMWKNGRIGDGEICKCLGQHMRNLHRIIFSFSWQKNEVRLRSIQGDSLILMINLFVSAEWGSWNPWVLPRIWWRRAHWKNGPTSLSSTGSLITPVPLENLRIILSVLFLVNQHLTTNLRYGKVVISMKNKFNLPMKDYKQYCISGLEIFLFYK